MYKAAKIPQSKPASNLVHIKSNPKTTGSTNTHPDLMNSSTLSKTSNISKPKSFSTTQSSIKKTQVKKVAGFYTKLIKLAKLSQELSPQKCRYLVDKTGHSLIFFKYKGRLINIPDLMIEVAAGKKTKEQIVEQIRLSLLWGMKSGEYIILYLGSGDQNLNQYFEGIPFWKPIKLFQPSSKIDYEWYKSNLVSQKDQSPQQFVPGQYTLIIGVNKSTPLATIGNLLQIDQSVFSGIQIV